MPTRKSSKTKAMNPARTLAKGRKNLAALKAAHANPKTSPAGKKTLEEMIILQGQQNAKLEKMLASLGGVPKDKR